MELENGVDKASDKARNLEAFVDVYMPLRLQHQISQTVKDCIQNRKGRYLLGIVNNLICN